MLVEEKETDRLSYTHIQQGSSRVCIMLSGASYSFDRPLLYYSTMVMLRHGIDVVHVHYPYSKEQLQQPKVDLADLMYHDLHSLVHVMPTYEEQLFLGKSIGTVPLLLKPLPAKALILLTPLLKEESIRQAYLTHPSHMLTIMGDEDPHFSDQAWRGVPSPKKIIPGANHSLDVGMDAESSITAIQKAMEELARFIS
ncbi:alpha/beta hydrolase [Halobacillus litoralis]|uniref:alpha/beta hydrolase n=1 Tax=Halobacillus litoralis TaxID=45668 RepID=UPI001CD704DB|nr:alpha/beta hydrolase [Halobacillus litoralis]MCA0971710.1 alpha/beta hydrolase [Halobacillus litoralis]